jgi:signal transduction histidine kinase
VPNKFIKLCLLILLLLQGLLVGLSVAQATPAYTFYIVEDTVRNFTADEAYSLFLQGQYTPLKNQRFSPGITTSVFWLLADFAPSQKSEAYKLVIGNAHINTIDYYHLQSGKPVPVINTGDYYSFSQRMINDPLFVFPVQTEKETHSQHLFRIDKHSESLQLSVAVETAEGYYKRNTNDALINGILTGVMILILTLGLFLFITTKDMLYAYYVLHILMAWLWVIADKGYGYQYLWPDLPFFASRARPLFTVLSGMAIIQFIQAFIRQDKKSPFYKPFKVVQVVYAAFALLFITKVDIATDWIRIIPIASILVLSIVTTTLIILSIIERLRQGEKMALFLISAIVVAFFFYTTEVMAHSGISLFSSYILSNFGIHIGLLAEALVLLFGLSSRFNRYRKDREALLIAIHKKQDELTEKVLAMQEKERKKIADQLHDEVGSLLSVVSLNISSALEKSPAAITTIPSLTTAQEVLGSAALLVRNISHTLTPVAIEKYGFKRAIENLLSSINSSGKINIEHTILGFETTEAYPSTFLNDIYRSVQEMLSNIIKHAEATHAYLELIEHEDLISIMVEDNGKGMPEGSSFAKGYGLENIYSRVSYHKGHIEINSTPTTGTLIIIELPAKKI